MKWKKRAIKHKYVTINENDYSIPMTRMLNIEVKLVGYQETNSNLKVKLIEYDEIKLRVTANEKELEELRPIQKKSTLKNLGGGCKRVVKLH